MASTVGELPTMEQLVVGTKVEGVSYQNIQFQHSTWMGASGPYGFVDVQAGFTLHCKEGDTCSGGTGQGAGEHRDTPASLRFRGSKNVSFSDCGFR